MRQRRDPTRLDPTRTIALRTQATAFVRRQFDELERLVEDLVERRNYYDLPNPVGNANPDQPRDLLGRFAGGGFVERNGKALEYHFNPSPNKVAALLKATEFGQLRGLVDDNNMIVWDADRQMHRDMMTKLDTTKDWDKGQLHQVMIEKVKDKVVYHCQGDSTSWMKDHPLFAKTEPREVYPSGHHVTVNLLVENAPAGRFAFESSLQKLRNFERWLRKHTKRVVLGERREKLWEKFIKQAHAKGMGRSFDDAKGKKRKRWKPGEGAFYAGSKNEFLRSSFGQPETIDKVKLLAARTFADVKNLTSHVRTKLGRVLVDGVAQGQNPRKVAATMVKELKIGKARAETIARTEIVRAHAEGQLDALEKLGVKSVGAKVEWLVTEDEKLCPLCEELEGKVFKIAKARGLLPRHPNCRCAWAPHFPEDDEPKKRKRRPVRNVDPIAHANALIDRGINPLIRLGPDLERLKFRTRPVPEPGGSYQEVNVGDLWTIQSWVDRERLRSANGPPIKVDRWRGMLIVTDGNHRAVSALLLGKKTLDAWVTDLDTGEPHGGTR